jgi:hypothetical protein
MKLFTALLAANIATAVFCVLALGVVDRSSVLMGKAPSGTTHLDKKPDLLFPHGDMNDKGALKAWSASGKVRVALDRSIYISAPSSLRLDVDDDIGGSAQYEILPIDNSVITSGHIRVTGQVKGALIIQMKDGLAPQVRLAEEAISTLAPKPDQWGEFRLRAKFPVSYFSAQLVLQTKGHGHVWLDDIVTTRVK